MEFIYFFHWFPIHFASAVSNYEILFNILRIEGTEDEIFRKCDDGILN